MRLSLPLPAAKDVFSTNISSSKCLNITVSSLPTVFFGVDLADWTLQVFHLPFKNAENNNNGENICLVKTVNGNSTVPPYCYWQLCCSSIHPEILGSPLATALQWKPKLGQLSDPIILSQIPALLSRMQVVHLHGSASSPAPLHGVIMQPSDLDLSVSRCSTCPMTPAGFGSPCCRSPFRSVIQALKITGCPISSLEPCPECLPRSCSCGRPLISRP